MANNSLTDIVNNFADGKGSFNVTAASSVGTLTAPTISSGTFTPSLSFNIIGTTTPGTLVGFPTVSAAQQTLYTSMQSGSLEQYIPCFLYQFGTIARGTTTLTHTASVTRMRRTVYGTANTAIPLIPMLYCTTAVSGGSTITIVMDYVNQDGTSKSGTYTWSFTGATVNAASPFFLMPNEGTETTPGDTAVLDVTAMTINWGTAAAGNFTLYLVEFLDMIGCHAASIPTNRDNIYGGMNISDMSPASPDAGSPTTIFALLSPSNLGSGTPSIIRTAVTV